MIPRSEVREEIYASDAKRHINFNLAKLGAGRWKSGILQPFDKAPVSAAWAVDRASTDAQQIRDQRIE